MEGEAPLKDEQKQLQAGANQKEDDADETFLLLLEGLEDLQGIYPLITPVALFPTGFSSLASLLKFSVQKLEPDLNMRPNQR